MFNNFSLKIKLLILAFGFFISFGVLIGIIFFNQNKMTNEASMSLNSVIEQEVAQKIKLATDSMAYSLGELVKDWMKNHK